MNFIQDAAGPGELELLVPPLELHGGPQTGARQWQAVVRVSRKFITSFYVYNTTVTILWHIHDADKIIKCVYIGLIF